MRKERNNDNLNESIRNLEIERDTLKIEIGDKQRKLSKIVKRIKDIRAEINANKEIRFSDHAFVRYLERANQIDVEQIKNLLLTEKFTNLVCDFNGSGKIPLGDDITAVLENWTIVTVY